MAIIGIDLGTTNSLVAIWKNGESVLIPNEFGEYLTPSVVGIDDQDEVIVGKIAKERLVSHPDKTAAVFKRNMGSSTKYKLGKRIYAPEELSAFVLFPTLLIDAMLTSFFTFLEVLTTVFSSFTKLLVEVLILFPKPTLELFPVLIYLSKTISIST